MKARSMMLAVAASLACGGTKSADEQLLSADSTLGGTAGPAGARKPGGRAAATGEPRTIDNASAVAGVLKEASHCRAFAPADWRVTGGRETGDAVDLASGDRRMYAGWGIRGVNRSMEAAYGPLHGDPETSSLALASATLQALGGTTEARYSGPSQQLGSGFVARRFESGTHKGIVVFRTYPAPPGFGSGSYIISLRIAAADRMTWDSDGQRIAVGVAASIRCTTMLTPRRGDDVELPRPGEPAAGRNRGDETDDLEDYNAQLGTQWVHSESTGEKFLVDAAAAWNENGPDGPGYYRKAGNSYEKLNPGFGK